jgi:long-chain acyl-CoA synthetase
LIAGKFLPMLDMNVDLSRRPGGAERPLSGDSRESPLTQATAHAPVGFWSFAVADPDRIAVITAHGEQVTAGELLAEVNRLTHGLRAHGLSRGDAVAAVLPNCREYLVLYLACLQAGLYMVPVNTHLLGPEIAYIVANSDSKVFVAHESFADVCEGAAAELGFPAADRFSVGTVAAFRPLRELIAGFPGSTPPERRIGSPMGYTSGTTGRPKGVRRLLPDVEPEAVPHSLIAAVAPFELVPGRGVHLVVSPLYHGGPLTWAGGSLHLGHTLVLMDLKSKWDAERTLKLIEKFRVTSVHMVPTQFGRLLKLPDDVRGKYDLSSLTHAVHAAAPCPVEIKRKMLDWWGPVIHEYYGSTEAGGTRALADEWLKRPGTVGYPYPGVEIAIFDDDGNRITAPGQVGTVYISTALAPFEYYKDPEKTASSHVGGFATAGDFGYLDDEGWLFLRDRRVDVIICGGVNIYPAEIEGVLVDHPKVGDAAVFGIPHSDWGQEVKAVIEPVTGVEPTAELAQDLLAHCAARLPRFKVPKSVDFAEALPRDPNGKLYKRKLRDRYWSGHEGAVPS